MLQFKNRKNKRIGEKTKNKNNRDKKTTKETEDTLWLLQSERSGDMEATAQWIITLWVAK